MLRYVSVLAFGHLQGAGKISDTFPYASSYMVEILHVRISAHYSMFIYNVNTGYRTFGV